MPRSRKLEPIVICPDVHRPYHDKSAWKLFLRCAAFMKPTHLVVIGDFADFYAVSSHSKDPRRTLQLSDELADVAVGLDELDALGAKNKRFIGGNHCDRLTRYLSDKAPELFGMIDIPALFKLKARGWDYTPYKQHTAIGYANFTHDVGTAGRNAVFKALDTFQHTVVTGHTHRLQYIVEGNALGEAKLSAAFGWLGDVEKLDYMHRVNVLKNWALGFGVGYIDSVTDIVYLVPVPIVRVGKTYTCVVNGTLFTQAIK